MNEGKSSVICQITKYENITASFMTLKTYLRLLIRLDMLIRMKATGSPAQLAAKLNVSRSSLFRYMNDLKDFGAPIAYCHQRSSYYYESRFELNLKAI